MRGLCACPTITQAGEPAPLPPEGGGPPPQPTPGGKHALLTCSGTWAPPGVGYPSDVAHGCADVVDEIVTVAPWSFGPIPPGDFRAPSYQESVQIGVDYAVDWLLAHPTRTFLLGGYSQGAECASRIYGETLPGGRLVSVAHNYVAGFAFGPPSRQPDHTFYGSPPRRGQGIAHYRMSGMGDDWCDLVEEGDMYGNIGEGLVGEIQSDVYELCVSMEMHSGAEEFAKTFAANCVEIVGNLDGNAHDDVQQQAAAMGADLSGATRLDVSGIVARVRASDAPKPRGKRGKHAAPQMGGEDDVLSVKGVAAAVTAAIQALVFFCQGCRPHCEYQLREAVPGCTYTALAIQHVRDYAARRVPTQ